MEIIKHNTGKDAGRISVLHTIATLEVGETWAVEEDLVVREYARNACSRYGHISGKAFTVNAPRENAGRLGVDRHTITRWKRSLKLVPRTKDGRYLGKDVVAVWLNR